MHGQHYPTKGSPRCQSPLPPEHPEVRWGRGACPSLGRGSQGLPQHEELLSSTAGLALRGELVPLVKQCRSHRSKKAAQELGRASPASSPPPFASQRCLHRISPGTQLRSPPCGSPQAFPALDAPAHEEAVLCSELCTAAFTALLPPALLGRGPGAISGAIHYWMGAAR